MDVYTNETRFQKAKRLAKEKARRGAQWAVDHKEAITGGVILTIGAVDGASRIIRLVKPTAVEKHDRMVRRTYYDPSTGVHWKLRREATNNERKELVRRKRDGEYSEDILKDLGLIK